MTWRSAAFATLWPLAAAWVLQWPTLFFAVLIAWCVLAPVRLWHHLQYSYHRRCLRLLSSDVCPNCGYCLEGLAEPCCPECGKDWRRAGMDAGRFVSFYQRQWGKSL